MKMEKNGLRSIHIEFTNFSNEEIEVINEFIVIALKEAKKVLEGDNNDE